MDVDFWDTPQMQTIKQAADAKMVPDMAMLALTLTALTAEIDHRVRIDSRGDGNAHEYGNLNIFTAAVGRSGAASPRPSKRRATWSARSEATLIHPSSGEGILTALKDLHQVRVVAVMDPDTGKVKLVPEKRYVWVSRCLSHGHRRVECSRSGEPARGTTSWACSTPRGPAATS